MLSSRKFAALSTLAALAFTGLALPTASAATYDTDGDKIPDAWEINGYDADGDGVIDINFPALGADPHYKDLFVEMDYMPGELATEAELGVIVQTFAEMPVANPDGRTGIKLHLDAGSIYPKYDLGGGNQIAHRHFQDVGDVAVLRRTESNPARNGIFHYMIWGDTYGGGSSSGQAWFHGLDFLVTVGKTHWGNASSSIRIGTFIHEFGHNLGLHHGGDNSVNYKTNYLSIMNYSYQLNGLRRADGTTYYGFSTRQGTTIDENAVIESRGVGTGGRGYVITWNRLQQTANKGIDFNNDGVISTTPQPIDVNRDGTFGLLTAPNDLANMRFQVRTPNAGIDAHQQEPVMESNELTADDARELGLID